MMTNMFWIFILSRLRDLTNDETIITISGEIDAKMNVFMDIFLSGTF